jgi:hypothetical protein
MEKEDGGRKEKEDEADIGIFQSRSCCKVIFFGFSFSSFLSLDYVTTITERLVD